MAGFFGGVSADQVANFRDLQSRADHTGMAQGLNVLADHLDQALFMLFEQSRRDVVEIFEVPGMKYKPAARGQGWEFFAGGRLKFKPRELNQVELREYIHRQLASDTVNAPWYRSQIERAQLQVEYEADSLGSRPYKQIPLPFGRTTMGLNLRFLGQEVNYAIDICWALGNPDGPLSIMTLKHRSGKSALVGGIFDPSTQQGTAEWRQEVIHNAIDILLGKVFAAQFFTPGHPTSKKLSEQKRTVGELKSLLPTLLALPAFERLGPDIKSFIQESMTKMRDDESIVSGITRVLAAIKELQGDGAGKILPSTVMQVTTSLKNLFYQHLFVEEYRVLVDFLNQRWASSFESRINATDPRNANFGWMEPITLGLFSTIPELERLSGLCCLGKPDASVEVKPVEQIIGTDTAFTSHGPAAARAVAMLIERSNFVTPRMAAQFQLAQLGVMNLEIRVAQVNTATALPVITSGAQLQVVQAAQRTMAALRDQGAPDLPQTDLQPVLMTSGAQVIQEAMGFQLGEARYLAGIGPWKDSKGQRIGFDPFLLALRSIGLIIHDLIDNSGSMLEDLRRDQQRAPARASSRYGVAEVELREEFELFAYLGLLGIEVSLLSEMDPSGRSVQYAVSKKYYDFSQQGRGLADADAVSVSQASMAQSLAEEVFRKDPTGGTPLGEAIKAQFERCDGLKQHLIVVMTDGVSNGGVAPATVLNSEAWLSATHVSLCIVACAESPNANDAVSSLRAFAADPKYRVVIMQSYEVARDNFLSMQGPSVSYTQGDHLMGILVPATWRDPRHPQYSLAFEWLKGGQRGCIFTREVMSAVSGLETSDERYFNYLRSHPAPQAKAQLEKFDLEAQMQARDLQAQTFVGLGASMAAQSTAGPIDPSSQRALPLYHSQLPSLSQGGVGAAATSAASLPADRAQAQSPPPYSAVDPLGHGAQSLPAAAPSSRTATAFAPGAATAASGPRQQGAAAKTSKESDCALM